MHGIGADLRVQKTAILFLRTLYVFLELSIIGFGEIDSFPFVPSCGYVAKCAFIFDS
jgi:hypothetical protein